MLCCPWLPQCAAAGLEFRYVICVHQLTCSLKFRMAAAAASAPVASTIHSWGGLDDDSAAMPDLPVQHEDGEEMDEVARLEAMMEEQNAEWQK